MKELKSSWKGKDYDISAKEVYKVELAVVNMCIRHREIMRKGYGADSVAAKAAGALLRVVARELNITLED